MAAISVHIETYTMGTLEDAAAAEQLDRAHALLQSVLLQSEQDVRAVANDFERIAGQTHQVLDLVAVIVACVDNESVRSILPEIQGLGSTAQSFIARRLHASAQIAESLDKQTSLLEDFCRLAAGQRGIARQTQILSVLTNIEVANLGALGSGFRYLAHELDEFSREVVQGSEIVAEQAEQRRTELLRIRKRMAEALPTMQAEFSRIDTDLAKTLVGMDQAIMDLASNPARFRECVDAVAAEVSSVVAAVQSHDITRQQVEHVMDSLQVVAQELRQGDRTGRSAAMLEILTQQLKHVQDNTRAWVTQIAVCLENIQRVSASDIAGIGSTILESERLLSSHLARMSALERNSEADDKAIRESLDSLDLLMHLMRNHLGESQTARDRMQLLNFNSMIEARHLGSKAAVMVEISQNIRRISGNWSDMTAQSGQAMEALLSMVKAAEGSFAAFSQDSAKTLRAAQETTNCGLYRLQGLADEASQNAANVNAVVAEMQADLASVRKTAQRLGSILQLLEQSLEAIACVHQEVDAEFDRAVTDWDKQELEAKLSAMYTTEIERHILRHALYGEPLPEVCSQAGGNDIEFF